MGQTNLEVTGEMGAVDLRVDRLVAGCGVLLTDAGGAVGR